MMKIRKASELLARQLPKVVPGEQLVSPEDHPAEHSTEPDDLIDTMAGLAHELNNPLTGVIGFAQLAAQSQECPEDIRSNLEVILTQATRCRMLIESVLNTSRPEAEPIRDLHINSLIDSAHRLMNDDFQARNILLECVRCPEDATVRADEQQILQVIINLLNNAHYAVRSREEGAKVRLEASVEGGMARLVVEDNGEGISKENLSHIFKRYFTTKPQSEGTGLGLPICREILQHCGGIIKVESVKASGTKATVEIPTLEGSASESPAEETVKTYDHTGKRVLLIERDPLTVSVCRNCLRGAQCYTLTSASVVSTLETLKYQRIDLMLLNPVTLGGSVNELVDTIVREYRSVRTGLLTHDDCPKDLDIQMAGLPRLTVPFTKALFDNFISEIISGAQAVPLA